jgi:glutathione S-transferase
MIQLIQFPWSPFCLVQRRILEFSGRPHKLVNIPPSDRSLVWRLTRQRYYQVPVLKEGRQVLFETDENSQVIAKYLETRFALGLFPSQWDGVQRIVARYIENEVEGLTFKLNDAWFRDFVPQAEQLAYLRHKERRFGRGCLEQWHERHASMVTELAQALVPFEQMLAHRPFLLDHQPRFVDFDLWGMLANFLYSGRYSLPSVHPKVRVWYRRMSSVASESRT